jgi:multidrug efflux pump subunit AcrB
MRHRLVIASAAALVIAASCATAPATEENTLPQRLAPRSSVRLQPVPSARAPETTGTLSTTQGAMETARADSEARRVMSSVGRTLERMEEMFRTDVP